MTEKTKEQQIKDAYIEFLEKLSNLNLNVGEFCYLGQFLNGSQYNDFLNSYPEIEVTADIKFFNKLLSLYIEYLKQQNSQ